MPKNNARTSTELNWLADIPEELLNDFVVITRGLYQSVKAGMIVGLFRNHNVRTPRSTTLSFVPWPADKSRRMFVMTYVLKGSGEVLHHGRRYACRPGDFFQLNDGLIDEYRVSSTTGMVECAICIDRTTGGVLAEQGIWDSRIEHGHAGCQPALARTQWQFFEALRNASLEGGALLRKLTGVLDLAYTMNRTASPDLRFLEEAKSVLAEQSGPNQSIHELVGRFHMSYSLFARKFRRLTGASPLTFKLRVRMDRACELLPRHSVKEVAAQLGYNDAFTFSRQFKQHFKVAPSEFKAQFGSRDALSTLA